MARQAQHRAAAWWGRLGPEAWLLVIAGVFAISAMTTAAVIINADREAAIHEAEQRNTVLTQVLEEHARRAFEVSKASVLNLETEVMASGKPVVTPNFAARAASWIKDVPQIYAFWLLDAAGRVLYTTQDVNTAGFDLSDREYFKAHRDGADFHVGRMTQGRFDKVWFFSFSKRLVGRGGEFQGVLVASMPVEYFAALYKRLGLDPTDNIGIYKLDGAVVARRLANWTGEVGPSAAGSRLFSEYIPKSTGGVFESVSAIDDIDRIGAYLRVEGWPLVVSAASDKQRILAPWRQHAVRSAVYCAALLLSVALLTWWGYRRVKSEARALADSRFAKAEADRANLAKSKFLAAASHDLRQPVQALTLFLEVLKRHASTPPVAKAIAAMELSLEGLNRLLASILDISRIDAGVVAPEVQSVDIDGLVHRLGDEYASLCREKGLRLRRRGEPGLHARTDPVLLERILRNLIENAIQYTNQGGLLIGIRRLHGRVRIDIVDSGIGIPADKLSHIFEEFYQAANPARDYRQGLGLGLSIVSRLAKLIEAEVQVRSHEGRGTRFSVVVRLDPTAVKVSTPSDSVNRLSGLSIMVIEDNPKVRAGLQLLLESWNCDVVCAETGEQALDVGERIGWSFDAVIADHRLGAGMSGTETGAEIGRRARRPIPTLIITGDTAPERIEEVHASGFEMMHKPVMPAELARRMAHLLDGMGGEVNVEEYGTAGD
jgi:signal transduction histidine kinase